MRKKFAKAFVLILIAAGIAALGGAAVYVFGPAKKTDVLYSIGSLGGNSYACDTNLGPFQREAVEKARRKINGGEKPCFRSLSACAVPISRRNCPVRWGEKSII